VDASCLIVGSLLQQLWAHELDQPSATECRVGPVVDWKVEYGKSRCRQVVGERLAPGGVAAADKRHRQFMHSRIMPDQHHPMRIGGGRRADGVQKVGGVGAIEFRHKVDLWLGNQIFHRLPGYLPGLVRPDRGRNQHGIGERRMPADPPADFCGVMQAAIVEPAVPIAARGSVVLGLGVTQQHQTAHGAISIGFKSPD
jgi:hypothetical protein